MKKFKVLIISLLCLCLTFGFAACGARQSEKTADGATYTVNVKGGSGMNKLKMQALSVKLVDADGGQSVAQQLSDISGDDDDLTARATFNLAAGIYTVKIEGIQSGFYQHGTLSLSPSAPSTTVTVDNIRPDDEKVTYKVRFVLPDGSPVKNVGVQVCGVGDDGQCFPAATDENGWATWSLVPSTYEVHVPKENVPSGYSFDDTEYTVTAAKKEIVARFKDPNSFTINFYYADPTKYNPLSTECTKGEKAPNVNYSIYKADSDGNQKEKIDDYSADENGVGHFTAEFGQGNNGKLVINAQGYCLGLDADVTFVSGENGDRDIVLHVPGSYAYAPIELGDTPATVDTTKMTWYEFTPKTSGKYEVSATTTVQLTVSAYAANSGNVAFNNDLSKSAGDENVTYTTTGNNFTFAINVGASYLGGSNRYLFYCGGSTSGTCTLSLTRTGDFEEGIDSEIKVTPSSILSATDMPQTPSGSFTLLSPTDSVVKGADGFYHLTDGDGAIIFVTLGDKHNIDEDTSLFVDDTDMCNFKTAYNVEPNPKTGTPTPLRFNLTDAATNKKYDYNDFYEAYLKGSNSDELHPLNDELITFLSMFYDTNGYALSFPTEKRSEPKYYFACGYFKQA